MIRKMTFFLDGDLIDRCMYSLQLLQPGISLINGDNWMLKIFFHTSSLLSFWKLCGDRKTSKEKKTPSTPNPMPKICCSKKSPDHPEAPPPPLPLVFQIHPKIKITS